MNCSGCRKCEIACSIFHEGRIWPEASRIRVFMLVPGVEIPHLCVQCYDQPCVAACPQNALWINEETGAILVDKENCTGCGLCIEACPGRIPHLHPIEKYVLICDLCGGEPLCVKACQFDALKLVEKKEPYARKLYAKRPEETTQNLVISLYGETGKDLI